MNAMDKNRFLVALAESQNTSFGRIAFLDQTEDRMVFSAIWSLESEVNGGGFAHYFASWDGDTASFAPTALRRISAKTCASLVERALSGSISTATPVGRRGAECADERAGSGRT